MPGLRSNIDQHRSLIESWLQENGTTHEDVLCRLMSELGVTVSTATLVRRLRAWNHHSNSARLEDSPALRRRIEELYTNERLKDQDMLAVLRADGFIITLRQLSALRVSMALRKRLPAEAHQAHNEYMTSALSLEYQGTSINNLGKVQLYTFMRANHPAIIGRNRLAAMARQIDPEGFRARGRRTARRSSPRHALGPNHIWSMDAHCKLEFWGIQIYAAMDSYSRNIMWLYVGISGRSAVSVMCQYLDTVKRLDIMPQVIRTDRGAETTMAADSHYCMRQFMSDTPLTFGDCFRYGTSKQNQRIEGYWSRMVRAVVHEWKDHFEQLTADHEFDKDSLQDRIAFLAVYMPIIRDELQMYRHTSCINRIRSQRDRVTGVPTILWEYPAQSGTRDYGIRPPAELLQSLQEEYQELDTNEYLPSDTIEWCKQTLMEAGFSVPVSPKDLNPQTNQRIHTVAYRVLRSAVYRHFESGRTPYLAESARPLGARNWRPSQELIDRFRAAGEPLDYQPDGNDRTSEVIHFA